jgi:hypothetical protein
MKKEYFKSMYHYEKSLEFDNSDEISHLYLYYIGINTGDIGFARAHAGYLSPQTQKSIGYQQYRFIDAVDVEYNYKIPVENDLRENSTYYRAGLNSLPGNRLNIYQSFSGFRQLVEYTTLNTQKEYYGIVSWNADAKTNLSLAYHYVGTKVILDPDTNLYPGNLFLAKITRKFNRFDISFSGAYYHTDWIDSYQAGIHLGTAFAGKQNIYLKSSLFIINEAGIDINQLSYNYNRLIFKQSAGISVLKYCWAEAYVNLGNLNCFADVNGMYLYNTYDPTVFKTGATLYGYAGKHLTLYANYNYDYKYIYMYDQYYHQHGLSGGMIWKI